MIKEKDWHNHEGQQIIYGIVDSIPFRLEVNEINTYGIISTLLIGGYKAKTDDATSIVTSDIPDEFKVQVANINQKYKTFFLVKSQLTKGWQ